MSAPTLARVSRRTIHQLVRPQRPHIRRCSQLVQTCSRQRTPQSFLSQTIQRRHESIANPPRPLTDISDKPSQTEPATAKEEVPSYEMTFTCRKCTERSSHRISKQGYHHGTILITCPGCKNRHLISDHLRIFSDKSITLEDILKEKGQLLKKGTLGSEGDVEFWEDGTQSSRETPANKGDVK